MVDTWYITLWVRIEIDQHNCRFPCFSPGIRNELVDQSAPRNSAIPSRERACSNVHPNILPCLPSFSSFVHRNDSRTNFRSVPEDILSLQFLYRSTVVEKIPLFFFFFSSNSSAIREIAAPLYRQLR